MLQDATNYVRSVMFQNIGGVRLKYRKSKYLQKITSIKKQ